MGDDTYERCFLSPWVLGGQLEDPMLVKCLRNYKVLRNSRVLLFLLSSGPSLCLFSVIDVCKPRLMPHLDVFTSFCGPTPISNVLFVLLW